MSREVQACAGAAGAGTMLTCGKDNVLKLVDLRMFEERAVLRAPGFAVGAVWTNACLGPDELHAAAGTPLTCCQKKVTP